MNYKIRMFRNDSEIMYGVFVKEWVEGTSRTQEEADDDINTGYFDSGKNIAEFDNYHDAYEYRENLRGLQP
jgi:hypothetical protein